MKRLTFLILLLVSFGLSADTLSLKQTHPDTYVVKKGDTLWDISSHFLKDPWQWSALWGVNPQIANPHLIYPGDVLTLIFVNGKPRLVKKKFIHKSPIPRKHSKDAAIPMIDLASIQSYILQNRIVNDDWLESQPQVIGGERRSKHHTEGDIIYVDAKLEVGKKLGIYQVGRELIKYSTDKTLGRELVLAASGRVIESGSVSKVKLLNNLRETKAGFKVLPIEEQALMSAFYMPSAGKLHQSAHVLAIGNHQREAGHLDVVYIDIGKLNGVVPGQVYDIYRDGDEIVFDSDGNPVQIDGRSTYDSVMITMSSSKTITEPDSYRGNLMVFKAFDNVSLGLILLNDRPVRINDKLVAPVSLKLKVE